MPSIKVLLTGVPTLNSPNFKTLSKMERSVVLKRIKPNSVETKHVSLEINISFILLLVSFALNI